MDISILFARKDPKRLAADESVRLRVFFSRRLALHAETAALTIEIASLLNYVVQQVESQLKTRPSEQALAHKFVDCWILAQGFEDLAHALVKEQSLLALVVMKNQLQRVGIALVELLTLLADKTHCELVCNLLIELNKTESIGRQTIDLLQA